MPLTGEMIRAFGSTESLLARDVPSGAKYDYWISFEA
jgi:hypothetical protein